ncbi:hypothetical protein IHE45_04G124900 [Dioscorea alata]|uniref:Uncharacterized protein n=1 Tax=Dioscorea alata TaxID=55571 RepID=A0ACB7WF59_DIOAL|nr:hypothetical protein IHE45_04G124900 [Dioscorea alata]
MEPAQPKAPKTYSVAGTACLLTMSVAGAGLLVWWALAFHPSNKQLWMVPSGLIIFATPIFVLLALFAPNICRSFKLLSSKSPAMPSASDII